MTKEVLNQQGNLFDSITSEVATVEIPSYLPLVAAPIPPRPTKSYDTALFYDYRIHGKLEIGETLILYRDGTFKKVGKSGR